MPPAHLVVVPPTVRALCRHSRRRGRIPWGPSAGALWSLVALSTACGKEPPDTGSPDQSCSPYPVPEGAPDSDVLDVGGASYICYEAAPEGVCRTVRGAESAAVAASGGGAAVGCSDGVVVIDGTCPQDLKIGDCTLATTGEVWTLYPCNRWDDLPGGEAAGCEAADGTWVPAP